jgi:hypothetical protein
MIMGSISSSSTGGGSGSSGAAGGSSGSGIAVGAGAQPPRIMLRTITRVIANEITILFFADMSFLLF